MAIKVKIFLFDVKTSKDKTQQTDYITRTTKWTVKSHGKERKSTAVLFRVLFQEDSSETRR